MQSQMLIDQYNNIRNTIISNVETIKLLVQQSEKLTEIIKTLVDTNCDKSKTDNLSLEVEKLQKHIFELIEQTKKLFELYNQFAEELFS